MSNVTKLIDLARSFAVEIDCGDPIAVSEILLRAAIKCLSDDIADMVADGLSDEYPDVFKKLDLAHAHMALANQFLDQATAKAERL